MQRHFVSYAPRFGSYKEPRPFLVKQSPYYWWWLALTLNADYAKLCEQQQRQRASTSGDFEKPQSEMLKVYADWGDVRYDGDRYRAFCDWWRNRVNTNEERGAYLFAEPLRGVWTHLATDAKQAAEYATSDDRLVIAIPMLPKCALPPRKTCVCYTHSTCVCTVRAQTLSTWQKDEQRQAC